MRRWLIVGLCSLLWIPSAWAVTAKYYDDVNDENSAGDVNDITTGNGTWCIWSRPDADASSDLWIGKKSTVASDTAGYAFYSLSTDEPTCIVSDATVQQSASGIAIDAVWSFVCCTWDGSGDDLTIFVNAVSVGSDTADDVGSLDNASHYQGGETNSDGEDARGGVYASMFYSDILTAAEMNELLYRPEMIPTNRTNLWPMWLSGGENDIGVNDVAMGSAGSNGATATVPNVMWGDAAL